MKKYNVILEGCDKVGKSTIADILCRRGKVDFAVHFNAPKDIHAGMREYYSTLNFLNRNNKICYDRWALGEKVYGPMIRNYYPNYMNDLESKILPHNFLFLITAELNIVLERFDDVGLERSQIREVLERFQLEFNECQYPNKFIIDTTKATPDESVDLILQIINDNAEEME
jgi:hypothetical protein